jgi:hypothetical protein
MIIAILYLIKLVVQSAGMQETSLKQFSAGKFILFVGHFVTFVKAN